MERFNSNEDVGFNKNAETQGRTARQNGYSMNNPDINPYTNDRTGYLYRSFCAGWADVDADQNIPKEQITQTGIPQRQFMKLQDLQIDCYDNRHDVAAYTDAMKRLSVYENEINWPWGATKTQIDEWNDWIKNIS